MKKYTKEELTEILAIHKKWLYGENGGYRADLSGANLRRADLSGADLSGADLRRADLRRADLSGADLSGADLSGADLRRADLSGADLRGADLSGADLSDAVLWDLTGNRKHVKTIALETYTITYTDIYLQIGCQRHTFSEWFNFNDEQIAKMDSSALEWWKKWKETIFNLIEMSPAEPTGKE